VNKKIKKALIVLIALVVLSVLGLWIYVQIRTYPAEAEYLALIMADDRITVTEEQNHFIITPVALNPDAIPIIYYPGGLVAPEAYLYKMGTVAANLNTRVYIIKAPFNAAIFNIKAAGPIIEHYELGQAWVGGHSLGGIAACRYVSGDPDNAYGLYLFGSYCDQNISGFTGPVVSVIGLQDYIINRNNYLEAKSQLPLTANVIEIEGLNHSGFGNYGLQKDDGESSLNNEQVIEIISSVFDVNN